YTTELAISLKCNQIIAEHRYFGKSVPDSADYEYLNSWQSASDHHRIIEKFKEFYTDKWIATGISKGGQTVMYLSYYYPDDVDAKVPYVAPLNYGTEDERIYSFLDNVGSGRCRRRIKKFQKFVLNNQDILRTEFEKLSDSKGYTYDLVGGSEAAFEYCVLEYPFAFWQWGYSDCKDIPRPDAKPKKIIQHMNSVAGFDYFADEYVIEFRPFFYQALTEMGYYGYKLDDFKRELKHVTESGFEFAMPEEVSLAFDPQLSIELDKFISDEAEDFIFIYGEWDTWSANAVELSGDTNSKVFFSRKGSHRTRIRHLSFEQQDEIYLLLESFLKD
ncbi:MAG: peptidase, partial [Bacteroidetes bacterium]|nr:peptidase [Bacteroidota bacterium]